MTLTNLSALVFDTPKDKRLEMISVFTTSQPPSLVLDSVSIPNDQKVWFIMLWSSRS